MTETVQFSARGGWSGRSSASPDLMAALQDRLPIALIATPRHALRTCRSDEMLAEVMARNDEGFDYFPVIDATRHGHERIIGLIELVPYLHGQTAGGIVREHMSALSEDNLIGADAGILTFVRTADRHGCRLVMSGAEISGLVSLSDLQQLPVRAALFALITHVEMTMAEAIRREFNGSEEWKTRLSEGRQQKLERKRGEAKSADNLVDDLLLTEFVDKATIIWKSPNFTDGKRRFEDDMTEARKLRDNLAHANEYAAARDAAAKVCDTVRKIELWIERLSAWCPGRGRATET
jgi:hypothetical protein